MNRYTPLLLALVTLACGRHGNDPSTTAMPIAPSAPTPPANVTLRGAVYDTAFRVVAGASVEIVEGAQAGQSTATDEGGQFVLSGAFAGSVTLRAAKDGYAAATRNLNVAQSSNTQFVRLDLESLTPPVEIAGDYVLTITADSACTDLPDEARTRRYEATISPTRVPNFFRGTVGGASLVGNSNWFSVGVAGDFVAFEVDFDGPTIVEELTPETYLAFDGLAGGSVETPRVSAVSVPFDGYIDYCVLKTESAMNYSGCGIPDQRVANKHCTSSNHRLTLTRR